MKKLKKCPWCGKRPRLTQAAWCNEGSDAYVLCNKCWSSGPKASTKKEAREAWGYEDE